MSSYRSITVGAAAAGLLLLSACGTTGGSGSSGGNGVASMTTAQAYKQAATDLKNLKSGEVTGSINVQGQAIGLDAKFTTAPVAVDISATYSGGGSADAAEVWFVDNTGYAEINSALASMLSSAANTDLSSLGGQCVNLGSTSDAQSPVGLIASQAQSSFSASVGSIGSSTTPPPGLQKQAVTTFNKQQALPLTYSKSGMTVTVYLATTGSPNVLGLSLNGSASGTTVTGTFYLKNVNSETAPAAPTGCTSYTNVPILQQLLSGLSSLGGGGGASGNNTFSNITNGLSS